MNEVMNWQMEDNLQRAGNRCAEIKKKHPEYRFRIETNVLNATVRLMVIRGKDILQVITYDKNGKESVRETGKEDPPK